VPVPPPFTTTDEVAVTAVPCAKLVEDSTSEVVVGVNLILFQLAIRLFASIEPKPLAWLYPAPAAYSCKV